MNFPPVVLQVRTSDSSRKMYEDERSWYLYQGSVYPDDRHVVVSHEVSTIVQFRNIDFRMERCTLVVSIPVHTDTFDPAVKLQSPSAVDVWILDASAELSPRNSGKWGLAPGRRTLFTTLSFDAMENNTSSEFYCPSGEFTTLELTCSRDKFSNCEVDFWQERHVIPRAGKFSLHV
ncbi:hypothetical protein CERSUDRAFT_47452 [Gelatoporia subvermispora B]|uniref:Ubiquitin 3 binding protein But2 C-terminal domain-containing protein n=1 Tax=Ceriporiopsis subvermispora (strain B) TaxID=914234 RepID=M2PR71_CERS8|nr:hypothetical protein CERSUDRAFT_47452 [Gelatoporia subvermispora B]